ncbi:hypothetical protein CSW41_06835 [Thermus scotoductus]|uniref:Uncharacterized protein n=1 Tax=Thermus scotoductus TaxID=37636 RepID=A0A430RLB6_THESC|nr:hypothetical protein CSW41_06835 [Thermus scotoductus]
MPHWSTVYHYFRKWQKEGVRLDRYTA